MRKSTLLVFLVATAALAQQNDFTDLATNRWRVSANVVYNTANAQQLKLDVYSLAEAPAAPTPVVMYIHGGGWVAGTKEGASLQALPYLALGIPVVNVEYRLANVSPAPAAVEDCRCALRWIVRNAQKYHFDTKRIVVSGASAGGHLALMTGMLRAADGFDRSCPADDSIRWTGSDRTDPTVAAIINWFGITDVRDMLTDGDNPRGYAIEWIGNRADAAAVATRVSPMSYVRSSTPPILTFHGDADKLVPVSHATRLHDALQKAGVANQLVVFHDAGHGDFTVDQTRQAQEAIRAFLRKYSIVP